MSFSDTLRETATSIWDKILEHPFLREMAAGTLPTEKYVFYIKQDYLYLKEFSRCISLAVSKAEKVELMSTLSGLMNGCLTYEMNMLRSHLMELGLRPDDVQMIQMAPTNYGYTRHMLHVAYSGSVGENLAALLPCMWTYQVIGEKLWITKADKLEGYYSDWIRSYRSGEYRQLVDKYKSMIDDCEKDASTTERAAMTRLFMTSSRYEYMFWDMAYNMETWPL
jgi:thiaminase/transcriptional activator TenA